ncbi:MAG: hypothetical protein AAGM22_09605 [Acidobacteriota bacterium]
MRSSRYLSTVLFSVFLLIGLTPALAQSGGEAGGVGGPGDVGIVGDDGGGGTGGGTSIGGGTGIGGGDGGGSGPCLAGDVCCGDGICEPGELCALDCPSTFCGDGVCNGLETCSTCNTDCGSCSVCGDGICSGSESCATCSFDCTSCFAFPFQAFYRGESNKTLRTATSFNGAGWSGDGVLGNGAMSSRGPGAVKFNNRIFVFYRGATNQEVYVSWSDDGVNWDGNRVLGNGVQTDKGVAATVFNNRIYVFNRGRFNDAIFMSSSIDGFTWGPPRLIVSHGNGTDGPPAAVAFNGQLEVYYRHDQKTLKHVKSSDGVTWTFGPDRPTWVTDGVALAVFNNKLYLAFGSATGNPFGQTLDNTHFDRIGLLSKDPGGILGDFMWVANGTTSRQPALAASDNRLVVLYVGLSSNRLFYSHSNDGVNWVPEGLAVGRTKKDGPALVYVD